MKTTLLLGVAMVYLTYWIVLLTIINSLWEVLA